MKKEERMKKEKVSNVNTLRPSGQLKEEVNNERRWWEKKREREVLTTCGGMEKEYLVRG